MMKHLSVTLIAVLVFLTSCQALQDLADNMEKPSLSITDVRVTDFAFNEIELTYDVRIENPNPVAVQMLSYDYDFNINENDFIEGKQEKKLQIESAGASTFQIPMRVNFSELYNLFSNLRNNDEADYKLAANLDFDLPVLGRTTLPIEKSGSLPMIKLPKIKLASLNVDEVNFSSADLTLNLQVDNPNGFGLLLNALNYSLNVNGRSWVNGSSKKDITISENNSDQISIPISLNISEIGSSVVQLLRSSGEVNYDLTGDMNFGATHPLFDNKETTFTFDETGDVPIIR